MRENTLQNLEVTVAISMGCAIAFLATGFIFNKLAIITLPLVSLAFIGAMLPLPVLIAPEFFLVRPKVCSGVIITGLSSIRTLLGNNLEIPLFSGIWLIGRKVIEVAGRPVFSVVPDKLDKHVKYGTIQKGNIVARLGDNMIYDIIMIGEARFTYDKPWFGEYTSDIPSGDMLLDGLLYSFDKFIPQEEKITTFSEH